LGQRQRAPFLMPDIATAPAAFGDTDNTLYLKTATAYWNRDGAFHGQWSAPAYGMSNNDLLLRFATAVQGDPSETVETPPAPVGNIAVLLTVPNDPPQVGDTVTAPGHGEWLNDPTSYAYQWQRCNGDGCTPISGETTQSYVIAEADKGFYLSFLETASNAGGAGDPLESVTNTVECGEITTFDFTGITGDSLMNPGGEQKGFAYSDNTGRHFLGIGGSSDPDTETQPAIPGADDYTMVGPLSGLSPEDTALQIASAMLGTPSVLGAVITLEVAEVGPRDDPEDFGTGAVITVTRQGV
jgi:hypothetical protein